MLTRITVGILGVSLMAGCGSGVSKRGVAETPLPPRTTEASPALEARYQQLLARFADNDRLRRWTTSECGQVAEGFMEIAEQHQKQTARALPEARYNAGLAYQRCGDSGQAQRQFEAAFEAAQDFHWAHTQVVLYERARSPRRASIQRLTRIVRDSKYQDLHALVALASLELEQAKETADTAQLERAKTNLQRALAIDDGYLPAMNQLALYYLELARLKADTPSGKRLWLSDAARTEPSRRQLDLAALVVARGIAKNPDYAPIHNTSGLIQVALGNTTGAVRAFAEAKRLDPTLFAAHMNYAAVNLGFRGFAEAERAYRDALKLQSDDFEARLGLALALRGQLKPSNRERLLPNIERELEAARRAAPSRPEVDYNQALLEQEVRARASDDKQAIAEFERAERSLERFLEKAGGDPDYADAVRKAKERLQDVRDTLTWMRRGMVFEKGKQALPVSASR